MEPDDSSDAAQQEFYLDPRCRLCLFRIERGEVIVADVAGHITEPFKHGDKIPSDNSRGVRISGEYKTFQKWAFGYHVGCLDFAKGVPSPAFLRATEYNYDPPLASERARYDRILNLLCYHLPRTLSPHTARLPVEIWCMIAHELVRPYAHFYLKMLLESPQVTARSVASASASASTIANAVGRALNLSRDVWASYIYIEGRRYIARISNNADELRRLCGGRPNSVALAIKGGSFPEQELFVLEDHIGVRRLLFEESERADELVQDLMKETGLWWRTLGPRLNFTKLQTDSDGSKLRSVMVCNEVELPWLASESMPISEIGAAVRQRTQQSQPYLPYRLTCTKMYRQDVYGCISHGGAVQVPTFNISLRRRPRAASLLQKASVACACIMFMGSSR